MKRLYDESEDKIYIKWDPKFKIGIPIIDEQHEHLVKLCNDFYQSLLQNQDSASYRVLIKKTLEKCLDYAATHFKEEERLMLASKFSGYKQHKASHDEFTGQCMITSTEIDSLTVSEAIKFAHFLYEWIHTHIAHEDRLYLPALVEYLKTQQKPKSTEE